MFTRIARLTACLALLSATSAVASTGAGTGPAITVPTTKLRAAVDCKGPVGRAHKDPVVLLPGTFGTGQINWGWNYQRLLPKLGHPACTVTFPAAGAGDIQRATQYAVYAIRTIATASGRKVVVMGHSQGGLEARWALRWWPDLRSDVSQVINLATPNHGALYTDQHCNDPNSCAASLYQMRSTSAFLRALNQGPRPTFGIPWTAVSTTTDTVFVLPPQAALAGADNVSVQSLCPGHQVAHVNLAFDGPTSAIVLDALSHNGHVSLSRIGPAACSNPLMPGVPQATADSMLAQYNVILGKALGPDGPRAAGEPPLACYVTGSCRHRTRG
jgi:pimeloyl-ACP methyl ester carboxylesterase